MKCWVGKYVCIYRHKIAARYGQRLSMINEFPYNFENFLHLLLGHFFQNASFLLMKRCSGQIKRKISTRTCVRGVLHTRYS